MAMADELAKLADFNDKSLSTEAAISEELRVIDVIRELESYGVDVHVHDPIADAEEAVHEYGVTLRNWDDLPRAHAFVAAVAHKTFKDRHTDEYMAKLATSGSCFIDVKSAFDAQALRAAGATVWRL